MHLPNFPIKPILPDKPGGPGLPSSPLGPVNIKITKHYICNIDVFCTDFIKL